MNFHNQERNIFREKNGYSPDLFTELPKTIFDRNNERLPPGLVHQIIGRVRGRVVGVVGVRNEVVDLARDGPQEIEHISLCYLGEC